MNRKFALGATAGALAVAGIVASSSLFTVSQTQEALILRFGEPVPGRSLITDPGLHVKLPFVDTAILFDNRLLSVETSQQEVLTQDSQRLVVDAFLRYRITDPLRFYQTVRTVDGASNQLDSALDSVLRRVLGDAKLTDVVRDRRDELIAQILKLVNAEAGKIGVQIVDARIRRTDFPREISAGVFSRMQSERQREAAEYRAEGSELAQTIRAKADREVTVLTADAQRQADALRGEGDAERNRILAKAYGQDPKFFAFYRSMQAYRASLGGARTRFVVSPTSSFFRYFDDPAGGPDSGAEPPRPASPDANAQAGAQPLAANASPAR